MNLRTNGFKLFICISILLLSLILPLHSVLAQHHTASTALELAAAESDENSASHHSQIQTTEAHRHGEESAQHNIGSRLPLWSVIPFIGILLSIALFPLIAPAFWHHHYPKVSVFWALVFAVPFLFAYKDIAFHEILHIYLIDYLPFIILLWGLFTVSGGILLRGTLVGTPAVNTLLILIGTALASWMGTTGAAMLMIRPIIRANADRKTKMHIIIFFIFLVANIGGSLTPLGDPPLFLGFIHGVPFFWTFKILPHMLLMAVLLLIIFFALDTIIWKKESVKLTHNPPPSNAPKDPLKLEGYHNFLFLGGILGGVLLSGSWKPGEIDILGIQVGIQNLTRDGIIVFMCILSLIATSKITRRDNGFTWEPIREVAYLFAGIFMCIVPALAMLRAGAQGELAFIINAIKEPWHYFWTTGTLSSFLDNAPTYLTFFNTALGSLKLPEEIVNPLLSGMALEPAFVQAAVDKLGLPAQQSQQLVQNLLSGSGEEFIRILKAISAGAVFFGANTYIGNAPNFMVRSIAEEKDIKMPSFFGYMVWSFGILGVLFILVTLIFF